MSYGREVEELVYKLRRRGMTYREIEVVMRRRGYRVLGKSTICEMCRRVEGRSGD